MKKRKERDKNTLVGDNIEAREKLKTRGQNEIFQAHQKNLYERLGIWKN